MKLPILSVSVVIPTGREPIDRAILDSFCGIPEIDDVLVVVGNDVYGRYVGIQNARQDIIFTQDDDCVTDVEAIIEAYTPGKIVNAMTPDHAKHYPGRVQLIGFGAIFDRNLVRVLDGWERDQLFTRECDRVFTALNECVTIFPKIEIMSMASAPGRLWLDPSHSGYRAQIEQRIRERTGLAI